MCSATDRPSVRRRSRLFPGHRMVRVGVHQRSICPEKNPSPTSRVEPRDVGRRGSKGDVAELVDDVRRRRGESSEDSEAAATWPVARLIATVKGASLDNRTVSFDSPAGLAERDCK